MSLAFRAYFALSAEIATSGGVVTNALHGFAAMLHSLIRTQRPHALAVAMDLPGGTFRDAMVEDYKGGRAATPPELEPQFDFIREMCEALAIPVVGIPGYEADDVLATLATRARDVGWPVIVVTGDRDAFQLVEDPFVRVLYNRRGVSDYALYDEAGIVERCGVEPARYTLLAAMRGDPSDNLPGVPGVGEKTAAKLLASHADLDEIFSHLDGLTPKLRENLRENEERVRTNARVMSLVRDVPIATSFEALRLGGWDRREIHAVFDRFEMSTMRSRFDQLLDEGALGEGRDDAGPQISPEVPVTSVPWSEMSTATDVWVAFDGARVAALAGDRVATTTLDGAIEVLSRAHVRGSDVKALWRSAAEHGWELADPADDTALMGFLVDATSGHYDLGSLKERYLREPSAATLFDAGDEVLETRARDAARLGRVLGAEVAHWEVEYVYRAIELPLLGVLARMEARGIGVDVALLQGIAQEFAESAATLEREIQELAGHPFNVNSPSQLQVVVFDELGLTATKKIKSGYSTDASSLEAIVDEHPIVERILRYREVEKLRSTYGAPLIATVGADGRIHATFNQMVARTGRISSENPNLHNIPVRTQEGRRLRYAFVPREGWELAVADYDQIELRILAHLSGDEGLLEAFGAGTDVHRMIASSVFGVPPEGISHDQREQAKAVSYGLAYGMESFGLAKRLAIPVAQAREIMDRYFSGFPRLRAYMDETVREIRERGYSRTAFGRIRPFPDLATAVGPARQAAERQAMNAGIQGLAADVFKVALVRLDHELRSRGLAARLVLQVHDEVLVEAPPEEHDAVADAIRDSLTGAADLRVPLAVSLGFGPNWAAAKG